MRALSYKKRQAVSHAVSDSSEKSEGLHEDAIETLEDLRDEENLTGREIDEKLEKSQPWYSNTKREDYGHEFSLFEYFCVKNLLNDTDLDLEEIESEAKAMKDEKLGVIEHTKEMLDLTDSDIDDYLSKPSGWYREHIEDEKDLKLKEYLKLFMFLAILAEIFSHEGWIEGDSHAISETSPV